METEERAGETNGKFEYVAKNYGVPACFGRRVTAYGKPGTIVEDRGHHIGINLDSDKPNDVESYHPADGIVYLGMGTPRKQTRSQKRYKEYLKIADCFEDFKDFLRYSELKRKGLILE